MEHIDAKNISEIEQMRQLTEGLRDHMDYDELEGSSLMEGSEEISVSLIDETDRNERVMFKINYKIPNISGELKSGEINKRYSEFESFYEQESIKNESDERLVHHAPKLWRETQEKLLIQRISNTQ